MLINSQCLETWVHFAFISVFISSTPLQSIDMLFSQTSVLFVFGIATVLVAAQEGGVCGSSACDDTNTLCGTCDISDPQLCNVGGTQHVCMENTVGQGGGVSISC